MNTTVGFCINVRILPEGLSIRNATSNEYTHLLLTPLYLLYNTVCVSELDRVVLICLTKGPQQLCF
jgi:hypothetical protein